MQAFYRAQFETISKKNWRHAFSVREFFVLSVFGATSIESFLVFICCEPMVTTCSLDR